MANNEHTRCLWISPDDSDLPNRNGCLRPSYVSLKNPFKIHFYENSILFWVHLLYQHHFQVLTTFYRCSMFKKGKKKCSSARRDIKLYDTLLLFQVAWQYYEGYSNLMLSKHLRLFRYE